MKKNSDDRMSKLVSLCKRRGYVFQSSEIYGGLNSCWDYGPLGSELKKNIKDFWWKSMVYERDDVEGIDSSILMHPKIWEASGHIDNFTDPLVDCKKCKMRFRADEINTEKCPSCGGELTRPRSFNLMFKTFMGPVEDSASVIYMRPETAQGIYVNFINVLNSSRKKIPFGIAQIGKAFRNEITPGNFIFRTREFEQMEMQYFVEPEGSMRIMEQWKEIRYKWYVRLGIKPEKLRFHEHDEKELAHYAKKAFDIQYEFPFGWSELEGIHHRTDYDLKRHKEFSGKDLTYYDDEKKTRYIPNVIETSAGCDRTLLTCLIDAFHEEEERIVMKLSPRIAPIKAAVLPLVNRDGMDEVAREIYNRLKSKFKVFYDDGGSIGRRYRRMDEAGTPFCFTVDSQTLKDKTVTLRERDSMRQTRLPESNIERELRERIENI
ncbi:MAG: glycine--tRNA ligase [bacterium]|nr:glycine--tRNA ligase [bacterium]